MNHLGDLLSAFLDGELAGSERIEAQRHLDDCAGCRAEMLRAEEARDAVRGLPLLEPRVMAPMPWWRRRVVTAWARAAAGVATLALAAGVALGPGQREQVFDLTVLNQQHTARVAGESGISTLRGAAP